MPMPNIGAFVAVVYTMRAWMCEWLSTLDERCWRREGMHPERGVQTLRKVCEYNTWHLEHHAWYLNAKVERFLGVMPAGEGCGSGCGCHGGAKASSAGTGPVDSEGRAHGDACGKPGCCKG
jgi:hypothetical protein